MPPSDATPGETSARQLWSSIVQTPEIVDYFRGVFRRMGITVAETGEQFTAVHSGDRITFTPGIDRDVEFVVPVGVENVTNLVAHAHAGRFQPRESWRIVQVLFTPMTRATLNSPRVSRNWLRSLAGVESLIHVHLIQPGGGDAACHTLAFTGDQWLVIAGLHGRARRVYHLSPEQALEFQRHVHRATTLDSLAGWWRFASWYRQWRRGCSVRQDRARRHSRRLPTLEV